MAIFSRGKRNRDTSLDADVERSADQTDTVEPTPAVPTQAPQEPTPADPTPAESAAADTTEETDAEPAAPVGISVSSFRGVGAPAPQPIRQQQRGREVAPPSTETLPGLRDNVLLAESLGKLGPKPTPPQLIDVARQLMQGRLILRVKGDAQSYLAEGQVPPLAVARIGEETFVVAYSGGAAVAASVRADGDTATSAMGQGAATVIRSVLAGPHAGIVIDPASAPASAVLRRAMLEKMLEDIDPASTIKALLSSERTPATAAGVVEALTRVPFWVAVSKVPGSDRLGISEVRTAEGERFVELFSHPLEAVVLGRGDRPAPMTADQLGKALRSDADLTGVIVDPAGPWISLTRDDLATIIPA
ncbi:SseB family protein [Microbacterium sp. NPDC019599]|uniref:SseB family protein n=1 Tax=Microbacterium sp. NPDC019599 TaxID=3154690 RepID=UPI0033D37B5F